MSFNASAAVADIRARAADALDDAGEYLLEEANRTVPIEEHILEGSGTVDTDRQALVTTISYDTPYAVVQHENPDYRHDPGRRAFWLRLTLEEQSSRVLNWMGRRMRRGAP